MLFVSMSDFYTQAERQPRVARSEEKALALGMRAGSEAARKKLIQGYFPLVAAHLQRLSPELQSLELLYRCLNALEKAVDSFDFLQESETFAHRLNWWLRQTITGYLADR